MSMPSSARSKLTALMSAPAPKASTSPTHALGHGRARPNSAPMTSDDAASAPHPSAVAIRRGKVPMATPVYDAPEADADPGSRRGGDVGRQARRAARP